MPQTTLLQKHSWARGSTFLAKLLLQMTFPTIKISNETCSFRYGTREYQRILIKPCVKHACVANSFSMFSSVNNENMLQ